MPLRMWWGMNISPTGRAWRLGMVAAGRMAVSLGKFSRGGLEKMTALIDAVGLPTRQAGLDVERVFAVMFTDKKVRGGKLRLCCR